MTSVSLDVPRFVASRGDKKKDIIKHWLNGKSIKRIQKITGASYIHITKVINEINN